mmetsp:Transcript_62571/g.182953  ORF Transcript_62571/g.182953 Transcript_62571/m.182953 type:complete len:257 (-) Transcript_62571:341-1111(-)
MNGPHAHLVIPWHMLVVWEREQPLVRDVDHVHQEVPVRHEERHPHLKQVAQHANLGRPWQYSHGELPRQFLEGNDAPALRGDSEGKGAASHVLQYPQEVCFVLQPAPAVDQDIPARSAMRGRPHGAGGEAVGGVDPDGHRPEEGHLHTRLEEELLAPEEGLRRQERPAVHGARGERPEALPEVLDGGLAPSIDVFGSLHQESWPKEQDHWNVGKLTACPDGLLETCGCDQLWRLKMKVETWVLRIQQPFAAQGVPA